ncbi:MAG TPA: ATP-binding cassette domain-containing protein, partial [Methanocella sp.]|nr:ATP-binding cassette domain-containing protein [Methanocella sp.]
MDIEKITISGGIGKDGVQEPLSIAEFRMGDIVSIVGPTGCGKTTLINDIELFADGDTPSGRTILINGEPRPEEFVLDPSKNPIALISQHTNFLSDLPVGEFLRTHAEIRRTGNADMLVSETLEFANQLTGEPINPKSAMTELSGGQTRSLLIADAVVIGNAPVILLDEIENAGIHRTKALELLKGYRKIFVFVTHDPRIALLSDYRVVMSNGAMQRLIVTDQEEKSVAKEIKKIDDLLLELRGIIRAGGRVTSEGIAGQMRA